MKTVPSKELSLILCSCLDVNWQGDPDSLDLDQLYALLSHHQVRPQFLSYIRERNLLSNFQVRLRKDCQEIAFVNMISAKELVEVTKILAGHQIESYAYKGSMWADWLYGNISQREFGDIDVLIPESDFPEAYQLLMTEAGYVADDYRLHLLKNPKTRKSFFKTDYHIPMINKPDKVLQSVLEAHWGIAYPRLMFEFPSTEWSRYRERYNLLGTELSSFRNEYQFLVLLVHHGGKEEWRKLKYVADLAAYMRRFGGSTDWPSVVQMARSKGIFTLLEKSLSLLRSLGMEWNERWPQFATIVVTDGYNKEWEAMEKERANSTWPYFKHGLSVHDGIKHRARLIIGHFRYFTEFNLIWNKFRYKQNRIRLRTKQ